MVERTEEKNRKVLYTKNLEDVTFSYFLLLVNDISHIASNFLPHITSHNIVTHLFGPSWFGQPY